MVLFSPCKHPKEKTCFLDWQDNAKRADNWDFYADVTWVHTRFYMDTNLGLI